VRIKDVEKKGIKEERERLKSERCFLLMFFYFFPPNKRYDFYTFCFTTKKMNRSKSVNKKVMAIKINRSPFRLESKEKAGEKCNRGAVLRF